jgi:hypothetical protein
LNDCASSQARSLVASIFAAPCQLRARGVREANTLVHNAAYEEDHGTGRGPKAAFFRSFRGMLQFDRMASLHNPVLLKSINYALTGFNISADVPFQLSLGNCPVEDLPLRLVWNDTDTVAIAKD